jgi:hypothetical protein
LELGQVAAVGKPDAVLSDPRVVESYLGSAPAPAPRRKGAPRRPRVADVSGRATNGKRGNGSGTNGNGANGNGSGRRLSVTREARG